MAVTVPACAEDCADICQDTCQDTCQDSWNPTGQSNSLHASMRCGVQRQHQVVCPPPTHSPCKADGFSWRHAVPQAVCGHDQEFIKCWVKVHHGNIRQGNDRISTKLVIGCKCLRPAALVSTLLQQQLQPVTLHIMMQQMEAASHKMQPSCHTAVPACAGAQRHLCRQRVRSWHKCCVPLLADHNSHCTATQGDSKGRPQPPPGFNQRPV